MLRADDLTMRGRSAQVLDPHYVLDSEESSGTASSNGSRARTPPDAPQPVRRLQQLREVRYAARLRRPGWARVATGRTTRGSNTVDDGRTLFRGTAAKDQATPWPSWRRSSWPDCSCRWARRQDATGARQRPDLPVARKAESQDICFVEGGDYRDILARLAPATAGAGAIRSADGTQLGTHAGIVNYTVGQRRGLPPNLGEGPRYVTRIDPATNTIVVGRADELVAFGLIADDVNLIRPERLPGPATPVLAATRYRAPAVAARATVTGDHVDLTFEQPHGAVAPGQLVALFDLDGVEVLGAGTIREVR